MQLWNKLFPSGAWSVWDTRLRETDRGLERAYYGYAKREAKAEHAAYIRELKAKKG